MSSESPLITAPHVEIRELSNGLNVLVQPDFTAPVVSPPILVRHRQHSRDAVARRGAFRTCSST